MRTRLLDDRDRLQKELQHLDEERVQQTRPNGEISDVPTHAADRAVTGLEVQVALQDTLLAEVHQIDAAIERMNQGQYGLCQDCGKEIPAERLDALPFATKCAQCAHADETA
jgi:RNA polymerase-binding protein DksA